VPKEQTPAAAMMAPEQQVQWTVQPIQYQQTNGQMGQMTAYPKPHTLHNMPQASHLVQNLQLSNQGNPYMNLAMTIPQIPGQNMQTTVNPVRTVPARPKREPTCFYCRHKGHYYDSCPTRLVDVTNECVRSDIANFHDAKKKFFMNLAAQRKIAEQQECGTTGTESDASAHAIIPMNGMMKMIPDAQGQFGPE
jgi:hypothetical protein